LATLPSDSIDCVVTSPPYFNLRNYGVEGQLGLESTPTEYIDKIVSVFKEVKRVMKPSASLWLNLGDVYFGSGNGKGSVSLKYPELTDEQRAFQKIKGDGAWLQPKQLLLIPPRIAIKLQENGLILRNVVCWHKKNPMPSPVQDRLTNSWEYLFFFVKNKNYYFDLNSIRRKHKPASVDRLKYDFKGGSSRNLKERETAKTYDSHYKDSDEKTSKHFLSLHNRVAKACADGVPHDDACTNPLGANPTDLFETSTAQFKGAHFACFPPALPEFCINAGCPKEGVVLDVFAGSGTTGMVARRLNRSSVLIELSKIYCDIVKKRLNWNSTVDDNTTFEEKVV
jgi:DNA modification methylase